ncbi:MAG: zinc ribbon domain-containing protein [Thermoplasmata archaeon]
MNYVPSPDSRGPPYSVAVRQITDEEQKVALRFVKPMRYNALVMSVIGLATAVAVNFAADPIVLGVPLLFALMAGDAALKYRKNSEAIGKALSSGILSEVSGSAVRSKRRGPWTIGPVTIVGKCDAMAALSEGTVATVAFIPAASLALSVNHIPLKKAVSIRTTPSDFGRDLVATPAITAAPVAMPQQASTSVSTAIDELPPPPDDWEGTICSTCGQPNPGDAKFCGRCGTPFHR